jgi:hypothetical protein
MAYHVLPCHGLEAVALAAGLVRTIVGSVLPASKERLVERRRAPCRGSMAVAPYLSFCAGGIASCVASALQGANRAPRGAVCGFRLPTGVAGRLAAARGAVGASVRPLCRLHAIRQRAPRIPRQCPGVIGCSRWRSCRVIGSRIALTWSRTSSLMTYRKLNTGDRRVR